MGGWGIDDGEVDELTALEAENGLRQADRVFGLIDAHVGDPSSLRLTPELISELNLLAVCGLSANAGAFRTHDDLEIAGSSHVPPAACDVPDLVREMCDRLTTEPTWKPVTRAAFVLWRINWIHPFDDGNGRTARGAAYLVLCIALGMRLPGERTLVERIRDDKRAYYNCLGQADAGWRLRKPVLRLTHLEQFIEKHVRAQLRSVSEGD